MPLFFVVIEINFLIDVVLLLLFFLPFTTACCCSYSSWPCGCLVVLKRRAPDTARFTRQEHLPEDVRQRLRQKCIDPVAGRKGKKSKKQRSKASVLDVFGEEFAGILGGVLAVLACLWRRFWGSLFLEVVLEVVFLVVLLFLDRFYQLTIQKNEVRWLRWGFVWNSKETWVMLCPCLVLLSTAPECFHARYG